MARFKLDDDHGKWIENSEKTSTIENQCILSNECVLNTSPKGSVLLDGFKTSSTIDRNGIEWTFAKYAGGHFGSEYVSFNKNCFNPIILGIMSRMSVGQSESTQLVLRYERLSGFTSLFDLQKQSRRTSTRYVLRLFRFSSDKSRRILPETSGEN